MEIEQMVQRPEQEHQEPEVDQQKPELEQQSELLPNGVPRDLYHADGTPDYGKALAYLESMMARVQKNNKVVL